MNCWKPTDIPDLTGKLAIVTGGNVGLGFRSALELCRKGAEVVIACRRPDAGRAAIERIARDVPGKAVLTIWTGASDLIRG